MDEQLSKRAGWYPDEKDDWYWRWWTGTEWSEVTKTAPYGVFKVRPWIAWVATVVLLALTAGFLWAGVGQNVSFMGDPPRHEGDPYLMAAWITLFGSVFAFVWALVTSVARNAPAGDAE